MLKKFISPILRCSTFVLTGIVVITSAFGEPIVPTPQATSSSIVEKQKQVQKPHLSTEIVTRTLQNIAPVAPISPPDLTFNFGLRLEGQLVNHEFVFQNRTAKPETILAVHSSCPCTAILRFSKNILPGGSGSISFQVHLDQPGSKRVSLTASQSEGAPLNFLITGEIAPQLVAHVEQFDPASFVEPKDVLHDDSITFLDVRPGASHDLAHIPRSMDIPIIGLAKRTYLSKKSLVLVGTGASDEALVPVAKECSHAGFGSVRILRGGIRLWHQMGGPLEGVMWRNPPVDYIAVSDIVTSAVHSPWILMVAENEPGLTYGIPSLCQIKTFKTVDELKLKLSQESKSPNIKFGVFGISPFESPSVTNPVFFVQDSFTDYLNSANSLALTTLSPQLQVIQPANWNQRIKRCPTCP